MDSASEIVGSGGLRRRPLASLAGMLCLLVGALGRGHSQARDPLIEELISQISDSSYTETVRRLQAFQTRYELSDSIKPAAQWLFDRFVEIGYEDVALDSFSWVPWGVDTSIVSRNVLAMKPGTDGPESVVILGGHYDSRSTLSQEDPNAPAPGANDNGSGTAGVLEIARILEPLSFRKTLVFVCFAGEELGFGGSSHYVARLREEGIAPRLSIVLDAIGYQELPGIYYPILVDADTAYLSRAFRIAQLGILYSGRLEPHLTFMARGSDHFYLSISGPAVLITEAAVPDPILHSPWDVLDSLSVPYATEVLRMALASVVDAATPTPVGLGPSDAGAGNPLPRGISLEQNYPNPFNPTTTIHLTLSGTSGVPQRVEVAIYDLRGRAVRMLGREELEPGPQSVVWDGRDETGAAVPSGIYFCVARDGTSTAVRKMTLLR